MAKDPLRVYRDKRRAHSTPEPSEPNNASTCDKPSIFVVQKHDASTQYYDFRLEIDGVFKS